MATAAANPKDRYFVPAPSVWPFVLTVGLVSLVVGVSSYLESKSFGAAPTIAGIVISTNDPKMVVVYNGSMNPALSKEVSVYINFSPGSTISAGPNIIPVPE